MSLHFFYFNFFTQLTLGIRRQYSSAFEHNFSCFSQYSHLGLLDGFILIGCVPLSVHPLRTAVRPTRTFGVGRSRYKAARRSLLEDCAKKHGPDLRLTSCGATDLCDRIQQRKGTGARWDVDAHATVLRHTLISEVKTKRVDPSGTARSRRTEAQRLSAVPGTTAAVFCLKNHSHC